MFPSFSYRQQQQQWYLVQGRKDPRTADLLFLSVVFVYRVLSRTSFLFSVIEGGRNCVNAYIDLG